MGDVDKDFLMPQLAYWVKRGIITVSEYHGTTYYAINEDQRNNNMECTFMDEEVHHLIPSSHDYSIDWFIGFGSDDLCRKGHWGKYSRHVRQGHAQKSPRAGRGQNS